MATSFSVVVTCYNYRTFVVEAVDSALAQQRAPSEVIVVDDGSTDGSAELLQERYGSDSRVTLLTGQNGGQLVAFQRGLAAANGDVVCFLDADDRWKNGYLAAIGALYDARPDVDFVFTDMLMFGGESRRDAWHAHAVDLGYTAVSMYLKPHWYGAPTSALSLRRPLAIRCLDLPEELQPLWRICADNCLVFGASILGGRKYFLPTGAVEYRIHGNNGWHGRRTPASLYVNKLRSRCLIEHYARRCGLSPLCEDLLRREYLTKPDAPARETLRYAGIALRGTAPWWTRLSRAARILLGSPGRT